MKTKYLLIYNPKAGKDKTRPSKEYIASLLTDAEHETDVRVTTRQGQATEFAQELGENYDAVICAGGDGTLNETMNGILRLGRKIPIGYIPMGSTNDLAATVGIPTDVPKAAAMIKNGHTNTYDVGEFNGKRFTYVACFGPGTSVSYNTPQKMKNALGYNAYMINGFLFSVIPTLKAVKPKHIRIEYDGSVLEDDFYFGSVSNSLSVAGMFKFDENDVRLNDGKFEVMLVRRLKSPLEFFSVFAKIVKRKYDNDKLMYFKASDIKMEFGRAEEWSLDGEDGGAPQTVEIKVGEKAVTLYSPVNHLFEDTLC